MNFTREFFENLSEEEFKTNWPELYLLKGVHQDPRWHPEGDAFEHTMCVLDQVNKLSKNDYFLQLCAICHDLGKALTPKENWPKQYGHALLGVKPTLSLVDRVKILYPNIYAHCDVNHIAFITEFHMHVHQAHVMNAKTYYKIFLRAYEITYFSYGALLNALCLLGAADHYGRGNVTEPALNSMLMHYIFSRQSVLLSLHELRDSKSVINELASDIQTGKQMLGLIRS